MKRYSMFAVLMLVPVLVISVSAQKTSEKPPANPQGRNNTQAKPQAVANDTYIIGASDELSISVWKEPDLTRVIPVRPDGPASAGSRNTGPPGLRRSPQRACAPRDPLG